MRVPHSRTPVHRPCASGTLSYACDLRGDSRPRLSGRACSPSFETSGRHATFAPFSSHKNEYFAVFETKRIQYTVKFASLRENPTDAATVKDFEGGLDQWTHYELVDWFRALKANRTSKETCIEKHSFRAALRSMSDIAWLSIVILKLSQDR